MTYRERAHLRQVRVQEFRNPKPWSPEVPIPSLASVHMYTPPARSARSPHVGPASPSLWPPPPSSVGPCLLPALQTKDRHFSYNNLWLIWKSADPVCAAEPFDRQRLSMAWPEQVPGQQPSPPPSLQQGAHFPLTLTSRDAWMGGLQAFQGASFWLKSK